MSDIENELRRLGDNLRSGTRGSETLPVRQRRRIKLRRALFAAGGAVTALVLVASATYGLGFVRDQRDIAPAEDASSTLIRFDRSGGFTGYHYVLTVRRDASALLESMGSRGLVDPVEFELEPDVMAALRDEVRQIDWPRVEGHRTGSIRIGVADGYRFEISHPPYTVVTEPGVNPGSLRPLIDVLNGIIEERLNDAVPDEPSLTLSEAEVRPGDIVELAIRAPSEYTWGVLTPLKAQRDGGWRRVAYWRTWPGKGPKILEPITTRGGTIEAIGFSGSAEFKLEIPQLDPGIYRVTKDFSIVTGAGSEGGEFRETQTAEVRFEVLADDLGDECHVPVRPTYLPWVDDHERVPSPEITTTGRADTLLWSKPESMAYVILRANAEDPGGAGRPTGIRIGGVEGELYAGESPASASILWTMQGPCPLLTLQLHDPSMEPGEARQQVLRIAKSLRQR